MKSGETISRYRILGPLGKGGMGVVYAAEDLRLGRKVALKFLPEESLDETERKRFLNEARAAAQVRHPNICPMYDVEEVDGRVFLAMAHIEGETLSKRIKKGLVPMSDVLRWGSELASGIEAAHSAGIVHRDIKSNNVMVDEQGRAMILDFGLALMGGEERLTIAGRAVGTPAYMSPEQARGGVVDERTDLWALGVVLYELTTGKLPGLVPARLRELRPEASVELEELVAKAMSERVADRWQNARELKQALERVAMGSVESETRTAMLVQAPQRKPWWWLGFVAAGILGLAGWGLYRETSKTAAPPLSATAKEEVKRVALLPFEAKSEQARVLSDGLMEVLANTISVAEREGHKVWVVPISEVRNQKLSSAEEARRVYGVDLAILGQAESLGDGVSLVLQLVDTATLRKVGEKRVVYDPAKALESGDLAVSAMRELLRVPDEPKPLTSTPSGTKRGKSGDSYGAYLEGRGLMAHREKGGNLDRAIEKFEEAVAKDGNFAMAFASLGEAHWDKAVESSGSPEHAALALRNARRAIELNDMLAISHAKLGMILAESGKQEEGIRELKRALELSPGNADAYRELANVYEVQGRFAEAEKHYLESIQARPTDWYSYDNLADFYLNRGKLAEAETNYRLAAKYAPENAGIIRSIGRLYRMNGRYKDAVSEFQRSIQMQPLAITYNSLGLTYYYMHQYQQSILALEAAIELDPKSHQYWGNLGASCSMSIEDRDKAVPAFRKAIEYAENLLKVSPTQYSTMAALAEYRARLGDKKRTWAEIERIPESARGSVASRLVLAQEWTGLRKDALETVRKYFSTKVRLRELLDEPALERLQADADFKNLIASLKTN